MSAAPTRVACPAPSPVASAFPGAPFDSGNRVLASIGRQESLRALLAFSDLHENIRSRQSEISDPDLAQTERFVLHEVLQLIADRAQSLTHADAVIVALSEGLDLVCRASAGPLPVPLGIRLSQQSAFLRECVTSGRVLRSDDIEIDARTDRDFARQLEARSSIVVPLRGRGECLGVLQAFSRSPWSFTDHDIRCLDLFAELVLAALKPEDQDRRVDWLSGVAGQILQPQVSQPQIPQPEIQESKTAETLTEEIAPQQTVETETVRPSTQEALSAAAPIEPDHVALAESAPAIAAAPEETEPTETVALPSLEELTEAIVIPVNEVELPDLKFADIDLIAPALAEAGQTIHHLEQAVDEEYGFDATAPQGAAEPEFTPAPSFLQESTGLLSSRPGLSVVVGLVAVAALFSIGVWWGIQSHSRSAPKIAAAPRSVTSPAAPDVASPLPADNLLSPVPASQAGDAPLTPVPADKLASLPKVTGVRHWSSSMGSTVVIDMQDQVNYEVHRLMSPERIYFDLHDTSLASSLDGKAMDVGDTSLTRVRIAQPVAGITRIVLDTKDGSNFSVSMESNPYRLVVELKNADVRTASLRDSTKSVAPRALPAAPLAAANSAPAQPVPARTGKFRIVLDAGHGGWDLGTVGRQGLLEKDLVLDVTKRLGKLLQSRLGADVLFTRTGDDYLALDQRADYANQAQADLFVSVHANYSSSANARGVETYYTNLFAAPGSRELSSRELSSRDPASKEMGLNEIGSRESEKLSDGSHLTPASLTPAGLQEKLEESRRLASSVQRSLYSTLAAKSPDIRDRGIKDASFVVLTGTTMPSILTEISFVSSPADERNLQSEAYRQQIAEALYKGIARYQDSSPRTKVAQLRSTSTTR